MRKLKLWILAIILAAPLTAIGQEAPTMYWVHEHRVKPSMLMEYETAVKSIVDHCRKHNIQQMSWITSATDDHRYLYVSPINSMSDINYDGFETLEQAMGNEAFGQMFAEMNKCTDMQGDYVLHLNQELTYMPDGFTQTPEGENYRRFYYVRTTPEHNAMLYEKMKAVKEFFAQKGSKMQYRVYQSGFGTMGDYYLVAVAAKDGITFETMGEENDAILGEERREVFGAMMKFVSSMEEVTGMMRQDLAYSPNSDQ